MNWLDIVVIFILIYTTTKGLRLGFILSIFNIIQVILAVIITRIYYPVVYGYIINNPKVYNIFKGITEVILKILFHSKIEEEANYLSHLFSTGLLRIVVTISAMILVFCLANILISLILGLFSFLLDTPVLKQLNKTGGLIFGLIEGLFIIYLLNLILSPIVSILPQSFIGNSVYDSIILNYLRNLDLDLNFF
ncbi:CvpA family protein [Clostridium sp. Cult2]|uniref:CvpA family protein n=1 Tax=Clostridium sp. Cult2 TaxID=2079003 RepID=UPI001F3CD495|nr:CvpA family protein [Clostridium sp. Cult2]MCF6466140.1 hypothetical protein [Clostridium sp. Cult2]